MNTKTLLHFSNGFIWFCALSLGSMSAMALLNPQSIMDMVQTPLPNTDAISSIRGIYGGAGLAIVAFVLFIKQKNKRWALSFLSLFWAGYALSRLITWAVEGPLGNFGTQWLIIESVGFLIALLLWYFYPSKTSTQ